MAISGKPEIAWMIGRGVSASQQAAPHRPFEARSLRDRALQGDETG
jgi:hypothetical protein